MSENNEGRPRIDAKEGILLGVLLGIILFVPLLFSHFSLSMWQELSWHNPVDISMIEWSTAFINTFLFLLLVETYRLNGRKILLFMGSGFLAMGLLGFEYALSSPGSETAAWVKGVSLILGSFYFLLGTLAGKEEGKDFPRSFAWIIIPSVILTIFCGWIPYGLRQFLPQIISSSGAVTVFGDIFFWVPGAFFFIAAIPWLHSYIGKKRKEDLVFAVVILLYAQAALTVRYSQAWGVIWWGWHLGLLLTGLLASLYLLILCLRYSLIWRLLLSLGFVFGLTVMISSGIIQSYFEKRTNDEIRSRIALQQRNMICDSSESLSFCEENLRHLSRDFLLSLRRGGFPEETARKLSADNMGDWSKYLLETGFCSDDGIFVSSDALGRGAEFREDAFLNLSFTSFRNEGKPVFGEFYFDGKKEAWVGAVAFPFSMSDGRKCFFYNIVDVTKLKSRIIVNMDGNASENSCGRMIICRKSGRFIYCSLPLSYLESFDSKLPQYELPLARRLASLLPEETYMGWMLTVSHSGRDYLVVADILKAADWVVIDIIDNGSVPYVNMNRSRFIFEATGMLVFLGGFIVLFILMNYQIARPLRRLIMATARLEDGDFSVRINSRETNELGTVSNSFDRMVSSLQRYYGELQRTVAERTKALQDAKDANRAKTNFFTNISHELRTPLHGILSFARLGMDKDRIRDSAKMLEFFTHINESAERLLNMINNLLSYAKLESGHMEFSFAKTSLFMLVLQVYTELRPNFEEKKMRFDCPKPDFDTSAYIDREKILIVIRNLLGNALKFSEAGGAIRVSFEQDKGSVLVKVSDEGLGIPENELDSIFDRFFQAELTKSKGGTGLGLSICMEIIKLHNGTIYACNNDDVGASFIFSVPLEGGACRK
ncbi:MAG: HAMP domain-containing sensor histidine kinase [Victivallales bacterium]|jgi:signal transduction histidine kinase